jgi:hypothetical protein
VSPRGSSPAPLCKKLLIRGKMKPAAYHQLVASYEGHELIVPHAVKPRCA